MSKKIKIYSFLVVIAIAYFAHLQLKDRRELKDNKKQKLSKSKERSEEIKYLKNKNNVEVGNKSKVLPEKGLANEVVEYEKELVDAGFELLESRRENTFVYWFSPGQKQLKVVDALKLSGFQRKDFFPVIIHNSLGLQVNLLAVNSNRQCYISFFKSAGGRKEERFYDIEMTTLGLSELCLKKNLSSLKIKTRCTDSTPLMFQRYEEW